jgi:deoxyribodipyrimidine photo-lyase
MNNDRCAAYNSNELPRPTKLLEDALKETSEKRARIPVKDSVVHWYKCDLRIGDNNSLHLASQMAKTAGAALICMYIISPQDFEAHLTSPARVDFVLRTLEILKKDLAGLDIPLYVETVEIRKEVPDRIMQLLDAWGSSHLFTNVEYEVDELRREAKMVRGCLERDIAMEVVPDTCIVSPGELSSGTGKQYSVYSPWYKAWIQFIHNNMHLLALSPRPEKNPSSAREKFKVLFEQPIPVAPPNKSLTDEEKAYLRPLWPAGEHEAHRRLEKFAEEKIVDYCDNRNFPAIEGTSCLSVHFSSGTLSARTAIKTARDYNKTKRLDGGSEGIQSWISEVAWRDFYKHVLAQWPFVWYLSSHTIIFQF